MPQERRLPTSRLCVSKNCRIGYTIGLPHTYAVYNATTLRIKTAGAIWNAFIDCCVTLYVDFAECSGWIKTPVFTAKEFRELTTALRIELQFSGVAGHNSIGVEALKMFSFLTFHALLQSPLPNQSERKADMEPARADADTIMTELRWSHALSSNIPPSTSR